MGCYWFLVKHFLHVQLLTAFMGNKWVKNYNSLFNKIVKVAIPCSTGFGLLAGPWWDSVTESKPSKPQEATDVKYGIQNAEENSILFSMWLPWHGPRLHFAWGLSHHWAGIFLHSSHYFVYSKGSDSLLYRLRLPCRSLAGQCVNKRFVTLRFRLNIISVIILKFDESWTFHQIVKLKTMLIIPASHMV